MTKLRDIWRVIRGDLSSQMLDRAVDDIDNLAKMLREEVRGHHDTVLERNRLQNLYDNLYRERREVDAQIFRVSQCPDATSMRSAIAKLVSDNEQRMQAESKVIADVAETMLADRGVVL